VLSRRLQLAEVPTQLLAQVCQLALPTKHGVQLLLLLYCLMVLLPSHLQHKRFRVSQLWL
jgi:hypothetical protein